MLMRGCLFLVESWLAAIETEPASYQGGLSGIEAERPSGLPRGLATRLLALQPAAPAASGHGPPRPMSPLRLPARRPPATAP